MSPEVCIVDDENGIGEMCKDYLADSYSVRIFTSPAEALKAFEDNYRPDLLLTDIKMPGIDGFEMAKQVHQNNPELPVVMMSGYANKGHVLQAMEDQALGFIEKPFSPKKMKTTIDFALQKSNHVHNLDLINRKYSELTGKLFELNTRYVERYARAENKILEIDPEQNPSAREALEFLHSMRSENRLNTEADQLLKEIRTLQGDSEMSR